MSEDLDDQSQESLSRLTTLGLNLVETCRDLHRNHEVSLKDLLWMLHGVMGQVLSWGYRR